MKKNNVTGTWLKRGLSIAMSAAMALSVCNVSALAADSSKAATPDSTDRKVTYLNAPVADGVYRGTVNMKQASRPDQYSMGNAALRGSDSYNNNHPEDADYQSLIIVKDGEATALLEWMPMSFLNTYGFMMELDGIHTDYATKFGVPDQSISVLSESEILTTHQTVNGDVVYDPFNDPSSESVFNAAANKQRPAYYGKDASVVDIENEAYPWLVAIDVTPLAIGESGGDAATNLPTKASEFTSDNAAFTHVFVPVMFSITPASGDQDSRMEVDWTSLTKVADPENDLQYQLYEAAHVEKGSASDAAWNLYQRTLSEVETQMSNRWNSQNLSADSKKVALDYTGISEEESAQLIQELTDARAKLANNEGETHPDGLASEAAADGNWYYYRNNEVATDVNTVAENAYGWWCVKNGKVDFSYTGLAQNESGWWRIVNGAVDFGCTDLTSSEFGWWYVRGGAVDFTYTDLVNSSYGWWYVRNGQVAFDYNDLVNSSYGWWYVRGGAVDFGCTDLVNSSYGWWYVRGGAVDFGCTDVVNSSYGWWYVCNGSVNFGFTGLAQNAYGWWYIENGALNFGYTGYVNWYGTYYYVQNGQVIF
ncbi:hypothetical protein [uncultured Eubacterium sp.]|uniref:hypothetical protein n=1 Tax=uncultured Eubacterium sp. TaxID=165185 RepID=UPI0025FB46ED|nr:hypothetical protein [uncultured Eubacterium sp.]MCI6536574.1 hypothetical protein [Lachnospiraceae bacterium]